jgi:hypothetical protein
MCCLNYLLNANGSQFNSIHIIGAIENLQVSNMFSPKLVFYYKQDAQPKLF